MGNLIFKYSSNTHNMKLQIVLALAAIVNAAPSTTCFKKDGTTAFDDTACAKCHADCATCGGSDTAADVADKATHCLTCTDSKKKMTKAADADTFGSCKAAGGSGGGTAGKGKLGEKCQQDVADKGCAEGL